MYVLDKDGIKKVASSYRELLPHVSFSNGMDDSKLAAMNIYPVIMTLEYDDTTQRLETFAPYKIGDVYYGVRVVNRDAADTTNRAKAKALAYLAESDSKMSRVVEELVDGSLSQFSLDLIAKRKAARNKL